VRAARCLCTSASPVDSETASDTGAGEMTSEVEVEVEVQATYLSAGPLLAGGREGRHRDGIHQWRRGRSEGVRRAGSGPRFALLRSETENGAATRAGGGTSVMKAKLSAPLLLPPPELGSHFRCCCKVREVK
jgi:hypothetical protein